MSVVALGSLKASPGVTSAVLALGHVWPRSRPIILADCDPAGGDLSQRLGLPADGGILAYAADGSSLFHEYALRPFLAPAGELSVLAGHPSGTQSRNLLGLVSDSLPVALAASGADVLVDCGRLSPCSPALPVARAADRLLLVVRPVAEELRRLEHDAIECTGRTPELLLVGRSGPRTGRYSPREVSDALGLPVLGVLEDDRIGAAALVAGATGTAVGRWSLDRRPLVRSARAVARSLVAGEVEPSVGLPANEGGLG